MGPKRLLAVGRLKPGPEADLFALYNTRLRPGLLVTEVPEPMRPTLNLRIQLPPLVKFQGTRCWTSMFPSKRVRIF